MIHRGWIGDTPEIVGMDGSVMSPAIAGSMIPDLASARMAVPAEVRLGPDRLEWIPGTEADPRFWREGEAANKALWEFIQLATERDDQQFVDFARRYGVLGLTEGGLPSVSRMVPGLGGPGQLAEPWCGFAVSWEPIPAWRVYAANAKAVMYLAMELRRGEIINAKRVLERAGLDSDSLGPQWPLPTRGTDATRGEYNFNLLMRRPATFAENLDHPGHDVASQRRWLARWVTEYWIAHSALIPTIVWEDVHPYLALPIGRQPASSLEYWWPPNMLFNILAAHLAAFFCSGEPVATCSRCGALHPRSRKPRADQPAYCAACKPEADKERKRRWKAGQRS